MIQRAAPLVEHVFERVGRLLGRSQLADNDLKPELIICDHGTPLQDPRRKARCGRAPRHVRMFNDRVPAPRRSGPGGERLDLWCGGRRWRCQYGCSDCGWAHGATMISTGTPRSCASETGAGRQRHATTGRPWTRWAPSSAGFVRRAVSSPTTLVRCSARPGAVTVPAVTTAACGGVSEVGP